MTLTNIPRPSNSASQDTNVDLNSQDAGESKYRHIYVVIEHEEGKPLPVSLEMLGEARRLMDNFNNKYISNEKVVAIVLGSDIRPLCEELLFFGADAVIYADS